MKSPQQQLLLQLDKVEELLRKTTAEMKNLDKIRCPFYFDVPSRAYRGLKTAQFCVKEMREKIKKVLP